MAVPAKKKAKIVTEALAPGVSLREIARKYDIAPSTLSKWVDQAKALLSRPAVSDELAPAEAEKRRITSEITDAEFQRQLIRCLVKLVVMVDAWADECSKPDFIRQKGLVVNELGKTALAFGNQLASLAPTGKDA